MSDRSKTINDLTVTKNQPNNYCSLSLSPDPKKSRPAATVLHKLKKGSWRCGYEIIRRLFLLGSSRTDFMRKATVIE